jgi:hypothetical protein
VETAGKGYEGGVTCLLVAWLLLGCYMTAVRSLFVRVQGELAMTSGDLQRAAQCLSRAKDYSGLLLMRRWSAGDVFDGPASFGAPSSWVG